MAMSGGERTLPDEVQDWRLSKAATCHPRTTGLLFVSRYGGELNVLSNMPDYRRVKRRTPLKATKLPSGHSHVRRAP